MRALLKTERVRNISLVNHPVFDFTPHEFRSVRSFLSQQFFDLIQDHKRAVNALSKEKGEMIFATKGRMQFFFTVFDRRRLINSNHLIPEEVLDGTISDFIPFIREADPNTNVVNVLISLRG